MHKIYRAEERNARQRYVNNDENETGVASFSVWRASDDGEPILAITDQVCQAFTKPYILTRQWEFRDNEGKPAASVALELSLKDFICRKLLDSPEAAFKEPVLSVSSEKLCEIFNKVLVEYRENRKYHIKEEEEYIKMLKRTIVVRRNKRPRSMTASLGPIIEDRMPRSAKLKNTFFREDIRDRK
ncbi:hypothetical protein CIB48_g649 [Xylaria polymorpha]|nr:hypothetical protein CIB48_g649 [Xylaria polymorpha]